MENAVRDVPQSEWVMVRNPDLPDAPDARVPKEHFELTLKDKGFELVPETGGPVPESSEVTVEEGEEVVPPAKGKDK